MEFHVVKIFNWTFLFLLGAIFILAVKTHAISGSLSELPNAHSGGNKYDSLKGIPTYFLDSSSILHSTSEKFLSFSIDSKGIRKNISEKALLRNKTLVRMMSYLSPGYLRIGGTEADRLVFKDDTRPISSHSSTCLDPNSTFVMTGEEWLEIYTFAKQSHLKVLFDFNVLLRKNSEWDWSNAKQLLDFSAKNHMDVDWQLGNEPNAFQHTFNVSLSPTTLARDFKTLRNLLNTYSNYKESLLVGPDVTSPRLSDASAFVNAPHVEYGRHGGGVSMAAERFLQEFVSSGGDEPVDAIAWHHYYLHSSATVSDFLKPAVFDSLQYAIDKVKDAVKGSRPRSFWITESGSACGGGVASASHSFVASFLFLDRLGLVARAGISLVVRQSLYSGNYALVDADTLAPNPDWWIAYVYKMLVAPSVLSIRPASSVPNTLRLYAHCSRSGSVVVFGVNLSDRSQQLVIRTDVAATTAELYQLTAPSLLSRKVMVNGKLLKFPDKRKPSVTSVNVNVTSPLRLAEHCIFFLHFNNLFSPVCRTGEGGIDPGVFMVEKR